MSKYGNEMISDLANLLNKHSGLDKTAAKKDDKKEDKEEAKKEKEKEKEKAKKEKEKEDAKKEKEKAKAKAKKKKKAELSGLLNNLVKLAEELDAAGSEEAASLVDDALKVIVKSIKDEA